MRKYYVDNIRWITVVLVVIFHVIYMFNGVAAAGVVGPFSDTQYQDSIQYILYPWFMVLLFIISGMCSKYYLENHSAKEFIRSRTRKLLVPSTLGLFVFHWIQGYINMQLSGAFAAMKETPHTVLYVIMAISGIGVLWYIQMLWIFSMVLILIRKLEKGKLTVFCEKISYTPVFMVLLGIAVWASAQVLNTPIIPVYRFGIYGFTFFLGYFLFSNEKAAECLEKYSLFFTLAAAILAILSVKCYFGQNYAVSPVVNSPLSVAYLWCACLAVLGLMKRFGNHSSPLASWMTRKSWGLYVFHYLPLSACGMLLAEHTSLPPVCIYLLTGAAAFTGGFALYELISRIPIIRWCVLGIKKSKEEKKADVQR